MRAHILEHAGCLLLQFVALTRRPVQFVRCLLLRWMVLRHRQLQSVLKVWRGGEKSVSSKKKKDKQPTYKRDNVAGTVHAEDGSCTESPLLACAFSALHWYVCVQKERLGKIATQIIFPK